MSLAREVIRNSVKVGKKIGIIGLGISGVESAEFLIRNSLPGVVFEKQSEQEFFDKSKLAPRVRNLKERIQLCFGTSTEAEISPFLKELGAVILSPGVPLDTPVVNALRAAEIPLIGELELGLELLGGKTIVVTGSNGKSTTVSLLSAIFKTAHLPCRLLGNIGVPAVSAASSIEASADDNTWNVVEASSYQLSVCSHLVPQIGVFLNLSENHLERHGTMAGYFEAKTHRFTVPGVEALVVGWDDSWGRKLSSANTIFTADIAAAKTFAGMAVTFDFRPTEGVDELLVFQGGVAVAKARLAPKLLGKHNRLNIAAAAAAALRAGIELSTIVTAVNSFMGLEHRIEMVRSLNGVDYINDSKATTVAAAAVAVETVLESFPERPVIVMLGGLSKFGSWKPLFGDTIARWVKNGSSVSLVFFGKDGAAIKEQAAEQGLIGEYYGDLFAALTALRCGAEKARAVVLFTPGCASFDAFRDFEDRGVKFKSFINGWS